MTRQWRLELLADGRVRARCVDGDNTGEIMEWRDASTLVNFYLETQAQLAKIADVLGLRDAWENS